VAEKQPKQPRWTGKQRRFVKEYVKDHNATAAARRAGYSERSAKQTGYDLLHLPQYAHVQEAIREEEERIAQRLEVTAERIQQERAKIAFTSIDRFLEWDGKELRLKPFSEIDPLELAAIAEIEQDKDGRIKFKLHSKDASLDALARMKGLYKGELGDGEIRLRVDVFSGDSDGRVSARAD